MNQDNKNMLTFAVIAIALMVVWPFVSAKFFPSANPPVTKIEGGKTTPLPSASGSPIANGPDALRDRQAVLADSAGQRVHIQTPRLQGSINLKGARIDDLVLTGYNETIAKNSQPIRLLSPAGAADAYFAGFGWRDDGLKPPAADAVWTASGTSLTPGHPVTLSAANAQGQRFQIEISVDDSYMFTVRQTVANTGTAAVPVAPFALINRSTASLDRTSWQSHIGPMSVHDAGADYGPDFKKLDKGENQQFTIDNGWLGFTDKYWLTALVPDSAHPAAAQFRKGPASYQGDFASTPRLVQPGQQLTTTSRFFAGAKEVKTLQAYENQGVAKFDKAIDWGWFEVVEKPIFKYLDWLFGKVGNFGLAIILLTLTIRGLMFPIAQRQFASMANMRAIQPKMKALQAKYKDDKTRQQQEVMALYKAEGVNPLAGCLPTFIQIPIFYALYKVLSLTIEMRHQPFIAWIKDLSAPDPLTPINLFGLLPFTPPHVIAIGVVPILLGISMYFQFKLNPAPMDDAQKQVFALLPWVMMFFMASFATGLQIYWICSNCLTIAQQQWLYSRHPQLKTAVPKT